MSNYLSIAAAIVVACITFVGNYYINRLKNSIDIKTLTNNASDAVRDDLIQIVTYYEKREQALLDRIDKNEKSRDELYTTVLQLREEIIALRLENQTLKAELEKTRHELEKFEQKLKSQ